MNFDLLIRTVFTSIDSRTVTMHIFYNIEKQIFKENL